MIKIKRKRYIVTRNNRTEIWCGLARCYHFVPVESIGNTAIKTYRTENQARSGCSSWDRDFEVIPVMESIIEEAEG